MDELTEVFIQAREYILTTVASKVEVFMTQLWDPLMKHIIIRETCDIIKRDLCVQFPELDSRYYPQIRFRIYEEDYDIEVGIQNYLNTERDLTFLGVNDIGSTRFDYYMRDSWDPRFDHVFIARYGHDNISAYKGSKTAEAEYMLGAVTPLSVAYGIAVEDGFIT